MSQEKVKTRFAPSPTGYLHVGGLRTALYAYLMAKKNQGTFILRIEDTDQARFVEGATENLIKTLKWAGLEYDEGPELNGSQKGPNGPYIQSQRSKIYQEYAQQLLNSGHAYRCFCTKERLDDMRESQKRNRQATMYDRHCLELPESEIQTQLKSGTPFVLRQKMPYKNIKFKDLIRGNVQFDGKGIDDQVLMKSDGLPTYHLANVVDDHLMEITHVIRGEEWLPSTPKHIALYEAFGWNQPQFAHIPLLLNQDKTKLSKRQGDVAVEEYIKKGYTKEAVINFIAFLGWNPGGGEDKEIFTLKELEEAFSLEKVHKSGAVFNIEKLDWFNWKWRKQNFTEEMDEIAKKTDPEVQININKKGDHVYQFSSEDKKLEFTDKKGQKLTEICEENIKLEHKEDQTLLHKALCIVEEKVLKDPIETDQHINCFFKVSDYPKDLLTHEKMRVNFNQAEESLKASQKSLEELTLWEEEIIKENLVKVIENLGIKNGQLLWPLRVALSGQEFSPGAFEIAWAVGKEETIKRIQTAISKVQN